MLKRLPWKSCFAFLGFVFFFGQQLLLPKTILALINGPNIVGPEIAVPGAGDTVIKAQGYTGTVSVINYLRQGQLEPFNSVPIKDLNDPVILRVDIDAKTPDADIIHYAQRLREIGPSEFPKGIKVVVLSVEANNLDPEFWNEPGIDLTTAGQHYAAKFIKFAQALGDAYDLAPAPPDLFNGVYSADPWMAGFTSSGACSYVDNNVSDIFELQPAVGGGDWRTVHLYQQEKMCGAEVIHFEGWGINPNTPPTVKEQVDWYERTALPEGIDSASTLIVPHCPPKYVATPGSGVWWYYINGRVFTPEGEEIDPNSCEISEDICDYNDGYKRNDPEFHSLRPYPHCPYEPVVSDVNYYMCGNDLIAKESWTAEFSLGDPRCNQSGTECTYEFANRNVPIEVNLSETKFPIMGLTEEPYVTNEENRKSGTLTSAQLVNEYVSWYMNGTPFRAENAYPNGEAGVRELIDYSGPLKKLLSIYSQREARTEQIERAQQSEAKTIEPTEARHDQFAVCTYNVKADVFIQALGSAIGVGIPLQQFLNDNDISVFRIPWPCFAEPEGLLADILDFVGIANVEKHRLMDWSDHKPPDVTAYQNKSFSEYWKDYRRWRGEFCTPTVPLLGFYLCFDETDIGLPDTGKPNFWGQLFAYLPLSSTEDRIGYAEADLGATSQPGGNLTITNITFTPADGGDGKLKYLYFPHMQETSELAELLQGTYVPQGRNNFTGGESRGVYNTEDCQVVESRSNPGDRLYGNETMAGDETPTIKGDITYNGGGRLNCTPSTETGITTCQIETAAALSIYSAVPKVQEVWGRYVNGTMSMFKRIYPKVGVGAPVEKIEDIPAEGDVTHVAAGQTTNANIYFPHVGSVYDYFLKGVQKALRPKGLSSPITTIGQGNTPYLACYKPEITQKYIADTNLNSLQPELKAVLSSASRAYDLPLCALEAILTIEGSNMRMPKIDPALRSEFTKIVTSEWHYADPMDVFTKQFGLSEIDAQLLYKTAYCAINPSGAGGPFQNTNSEWNTFGTATKDNGFYGPSHIPNRCNFADSAYTAAAKNKEQILCGVYKMCGTISSQDTTAQCLIGYTYYGSCKIDEPSCRLGTNYCDYVREYCGAPGSCAKEELIPDGAHD